MPAANNWMVDFDGVLADLQGAFIESVNAKFDTNYRVEEITDWYWWDKQPTKFSKYVWTELYPDQDWMLEHVLPYPNALAALEDLLTDQSELCESVKIVTARKDEHAQMAVRWLEKHMLAPLHLPFMAVGSSGYPKSHFCAIERRNVIVEDGAHELRKFNAYRQQLFLIDRPWNQQDIITKVSRVSGLDEAVKEMAKAGMVAA